MMMRRYLIAQTVFPLKNLTRFDEPGELEVNTPEHCWHINCHTP